MSSYGTLFECCSRCREGHTTNGGTFACAQTDDSKSATTCCEGLVTWSTDAGMSYAVLCWCVLLSSFLDVGDLAYTAIRRTAFEVQEVRSQVQPWP
jgi:hypothetical protein